MEFNTDLIKITYCRLCEISNKRTNIVNGVGTKNSDLFILGESPTYSDDIAGIPFTGDIGKILDNVLNLIDVLKSDCFITSVIKCKTPNRKPIVQEVANCKRSLQLELAIVKPKIVVLLGSIALQTYFNDKKLKITERRGIIITQIVDGQKRYIVPTFHPSYLLYNDSDAIYKLFLKDFKKVGLLYKHLVNPLTTLKI